MSLKNGKKKNKNNNLIKIYIPQHPIDFIGIINQLKGFAVFFYNKNGK